MKTASEMKKTTQAYEKIAKEQLHRLIASWIEYQADSTISMAVTNGQFSIDIPIPTTIAGHNDYIRSYLEDHGYQVQFSLKCVHISWENAE